MSTKYLKIAVFISGGGTNLQSIIDAMEQNSFDSKIVLVVSNKDGAYGLIRANNHNIPTVVINDDIRLLEVLETNEIDLIVLAGYLKILTTDILNKYKNRIINIHPSLLPNYGGKGMYGMNVHEAVYNNNDKESGATVHYVTEEIDGGEIILQTKIDISDCDSPQQIQGKVLEVEHDILKKAISILERGIINEKSVN